MAALAHKTVVFDLESTWDSISRVAEMLSSVLDEMGLSQDNAFDVKLATQEAVVNAVEHGNGCDPRKKVHIRCERNGNAIVMVVSDEGEGFDPSRIPDPTLSENILKEHGRGIFLMRSLCDCVRYNDKGNEVTMIKNLRKNK